jgi:general secretion pathway protein C
MSAARGARMVPAVKDGKPIGFKLYAIKQGSLYAQLGLNNGDIVRAVGGRPLTAADTALESYVEISKLAAGARVEVELERGGVRRTHVYTLR